MTRLSLSERLAAAAEHSKQQLASAPAKRPEIAMPRQVEPQPPRMVKQPNPVRVQFLVRLTEPARQAIRDAAWRERVSEQEFIERFALGLARVQ